MEHTLDVIRRHFQNYLYELDKSGAKDYAQRASQEISMALAKLQTALEQATKEAPKPEPGSKKKK